MSGIFEFTEDDERMLKKLKSQVEFLERKKYAQKRINTESAFRHLRKSEFNFLGDL